MFDAGDAATRTILESLICRGFLTLPTLPRQAQALWLALDVARKFFQLSTEQKLGSQLPEGCGYRPMGVEYSRSRDTPDQIESFTASVRTQEMANNLQNVEARSLHEALCVAMDELEPTAHTLLVQLASAISGQSQRSLNGVMRRWSNMQVNNACLGRSPDPFINDLHEDGNLLTLTCATAPGLELMNESGVATSVMATPEEIIVMPGEIAWLLSGGEIEPLYHRVRADLSQGERLALQYFCDPDPAFCDPWRKTAVNDGVDIGSRVLTNAGRFGLRGFSKE